MNNERFRILFLSLLFINGVNWLWAQASFQNMSNSWNVQHSMSNTDFWGAGVSVFDIDNDGWDDITFLQENDSLVVFRNMGGTFERIPPFIQLTGRVKSAIWVDLNNNGVNDLVVSTYEGPLKLYRNIGFFQFEEMPLPLNLNSLDLLNYGVSFADYNQDGYLDIYLARYVFSGDEQNVSQTNMLLRNNGDFIFSDVTESAMVGDGIGLSFMGVWLDLNKDLLPDLYVINDRIFSDNSVYINNGDGSFTDISLTSGALLTGDDPMSATFGDFDNDGDLDIFCSNSGDQGKLGRLLRNNGDLTFDEIGQSVGVAIDILSWGSTWIDADNDGFQDLYVTTGSGVLANEYRSCFYRNEGGSNFTDLEAAFTDNHVGGSFSVAKGDLDNDGYEDLVVQNINGLNSFIWKNTSFNISNGRYVKIKLQGTVSNRMAIGSWIHVFTEGNEFTHYTRCGENYLSQNTQTIHFGLGNSTQIDSIIVHYPSGIIDKYFNLELNSFYTLTEGETFSNEIVVIGELYTCVSNPPILDAGEFQSYYWNTGSTSRFLEVNLSGYYFVIVTNDLGLSILSDSIFISIVDFPEVNTEISHIHCPDTGYGQIDLNLNTTSNAYTILWNNGMNGEVIQIDEPGIYSYSYSDNAGCALNGSYEVVSAPPINVYHQIQFDQITATYTLFVEVFGGTPPFEFLLDNNLVSPPFSNLSSGIYSLTVNDSFGCTTEQMIDVQILALEHRTNDLLSISPNPFQNSIKLESNGKFNLDQIELFSSDGKSVFSSLNCICQMLEIETTHLDQGVYFLKIHLNGFTFIHKILKS